jgi:hypothetical protein
MTEITKDSAPKYCVSIKIEKLQNETIILTMLCPAGETMRIIEKIALDGVHAKRLADELIKILNLPIGELKTAEKIKTELKENPQILDS